MKFEPKVIDPATIDHELDRMWAEYWEEKQKLKDFYQFLLEKTEAALERGQVITQGVYTKSSHIVDTSAAAVVLAAHDLLEGHDVYNQPTLSAKKVKKVMIEHLLEVPYKERKAFVRKPRRVEK